MMLRSKSMLYLEESLNADHDRSKSRGVFHLDDVLLYTPTLEKLPDFT